MLHEELIEEAKRPDHPSQRGYLPVIELTPQPSGTLYIGTFSRWAKPDGSDVIEPSHALSACNSSLRYGGFNLHRPNSGAVCIDPHQIDQLREGGFPLPEPTIVTQEGDPDLAPLLAAHLGYHMWMTAAFGDPDFTITPEGHTSEYHNWVVHHSVYHGLDKVPQIDLIASIWEGNCTRDHHKTFAAEYNRVTAQAIEDRLRGLLGRVTSTLGHESYWQT